MKKRQVFTLPIPAAPTPWEGEPDITTVPGTVLRWGYISDSEREVEGVRFADYWVEYEELVTA